MTDNTTTSNALADTQRWLERAVIGLNLCPFAKTVHVRDKIRTVLCTATDEHGVMLALIAELKHLAHTSAGETDTTLIVIPHWFADFEVFNDFLGEAEDELWVQGFEGVLQLASFHPHYQFADTQPNDAQNNTNRAPYPTLHILREASVDLAVAAMDTEKIYLNNIETMEQLGNAGYTKLLAG
jgi:uncharacterized protein